MIEPAFVKRPWCQELLWVQRNAHGVIVGSSEKLPDTKYFIPSIPEEEAADGDFPNELAQDRYWGSLLHIFKNHDKLQKYLTSPYVDFVERSIRGKSLKQLAKPWSESERFMLDLALHLFNESFKVNLSDMDYLDSRNKQIALKAIQIRFR